MRAFSFAERAHTSCGTARSSKKTTAGRRRDVRFGCLHTAFRARLESPNRPKSHIMSLWKDNTATRPTPTPEPQRYDAPSRPRLGINASRRNRRRNSREAPARDRAAPWRVRENACQTQLVGLVCVLSECASERQQSRASSSRCQPLHGRSASRSSSLIGRKMTSMA